MSDNSDKKNTGGHANSDRHISLGMLPKLIAAIIIGILIGLLCKHFDAEVPIRVGATFNSIFGNFLNFAIPLIIVGFIVPGISDLGQDAGKSLAVTAIIAYVSALIAGLLAYFVDINLFPKFISFGSVNLSGQASSGETMLEGYFEIAMPPIFDVMGALLLAFVLGIGIAATGNKTLKDFFDGFQDIISRMISAFIIPLLPFHIYGIFANMAFTGTVALILKTFLLVFVIVIALHWIILFLQWGVAGAVKKRNPFGMIKHALPAYVAGLGTQSSAASIPITLQAAKDNGIKESIANFVIPLCATIHLSGSTITLTSCSIAVNMLNGVEVSLASYIPFILMLGITMVAAPGVPGGAVMAALGILQSMLGFNENMCTLMIALYMAQDSFGTACNITGDGAIAVLVEKIMGKKADKRKKLEAKA